jgi:hypothetical protein
VSGGASRSLLSIENHDFNMVFNKNKFCELDLTSTTGQKNVVGVLQV